MPKVHSMVWQTFCRLEALLKWKHTLRHLKNISGDIINYCDHLLDLWTNNKLWSSKVSPRPTAVMVKWPSTRQNQAGKLIYAYLEQFVPADRITQITDTWLTIFTLITDGSWMTGIYRITAVHPNMSKSLLRWNFSSILESFSCQRRFYLNPSWICTTSSQL